MRDLVRDLESLRGIARTRTLHALGHSRHGFELALRAGLVIRPRIGWLALPDANPDGIRTVALGGRLAAGNALASQGIWVDRLRGLAVHVAPNAARLPPLGPGERRTQRRVRFDTGSSEWCVSTGDALIQLAHEVEPLAWLTSLDSALHLRARHLDAGEHPLGRIEPFIPAAHRAVSRRADGRAESGNETRMRLILVSAGLVVETQVEIPLVGRVDLLIDGWLIVEIDSREHHGTVPDQENDRIRDGNAALLGLDTVRFMPEAVRDAPSWCREVVLVRLRRGSPSRESGWRGATRREIS